MLHWILTFLVWASLVLPPMIVAYFHIKKIAYSYFLVFLGVFFLDCILMVLAQNHLNIGVFAMSELGWWQIKLASLFWGGVFVFFYKPVSYKEFGITLNLRKGSFKPVVITTVFIALILLTYHILFDPFGMKSNEYLVFQATMPGLSEELVYRGIFLSLLNRALGKNWKLFGANIGWGFIIVTILFGGIHGIFIDPALNFHFNLIPFLITGFFGAIFGWMRERTDSILPSIIAHNLFNVVSNF